MIGRPELGKPGTKKKSYIVCSLHFDSSVITYIPKLQKGALPTKLLPSEETTSCTNTVQEYKENSTQTEYLTVRVVPVVFDKNADMVAPEQATCDLSPDTPSKSKHILSVVTHKCADTEAELDQTICDLSSEALIIRKSNLSVVTDKSFDLQAESEQITCNRSSDTPRKRKRILSIVSNKNADMEAESKQVTRDLSSDKRRKRKSNSVVTDKSADVKADLGGVSESNLIILNHSKKNKSKR